MNPIVKLTDLSVCFGTRPVLEQVSMTVERGQTVCLLGASGCGKTTLLNVIAGIQMPTGGNRQVETDRIGFVFQDDRLIPWRSVVENVMMVQDPGLSSDESRTRALRWLDRLGIGVSADQYPARLSGGMRRRVNLARALASEPELLLCDEPFAFLDPDAVRLVRQEITQVREERETTLVVVTHVEDHITPLKPEIIRLGSRSPISFSFPS